MSRLPVDCECDWRRGNEPMAGCGRRWTGESPGSGRRNGFRRWRRSRCRPAESRDPDDVGSATAADWRWRSGRPSYRPCRPRPDARPPADPSRSFGERKSESPSKQIKEIKEIKMLIYSISTWIEWDCSWWNLSKTTI